MRVLTFLGLFVLLFQSCASVKTTYDKSIDLNQYKTFYCMECEDEFVKGFEAYDNESVRRQIREAIIQNLQDKGLVYNAADADLYVDFRLLIEEQTAFMAEPDTEYNYWETYDSPQVNFKKGTLMINIIDAEKNQAVWQGIGSKVLQENPTEAEKNVLKTVNNILKKFKS